MSLSQIIIAPVIPFWLISLLFALGWVLAIVQYWLIQRRLGRSRALRLSLLRLGAISLLISFSLNPSLVVKKDNKLSSSLAVLVDTSESMGLAGPEGNGSRLDEAKALLLGGPKPLLKSLEERYEVRLYAFGESLRSIETTELAGLKAGGKMGDLNDTLGKLDGKNAFAILLSDGNLKWENTDSAGLPLLALPLGDPKGYRDLLIKEVRAPSLAFRGRPVSIDVNIKSFGYNGRTLPVLLKDGERLLTAKSVRIDESPAQVSLSLSFTPEELGHHKLSVSIPPQFGESLTSNNTMNLSLKVVRDKIRILMVSGSPSSSYRFMRMALKNDPSIDLLSFVILRTPSNVMNVPVQEQSLIPFPIETLFSREIKNFDLVLFDNFPYPLYIGPNHAESVKEFVKEGGSFAIMGGPNFSSEGGYLNGPLSEILPTRFTGNENYRRDSPSWARLSRAGVAHPITRFFSSEGGHPDLWSGMPALDGINLVEPKSPGLVLIESDDTSRSPILSIGSYGRGRALVLATDYSWKWYMGRVAEGKGGLAYLRLMERMMRWLTKDPSLDPVVITLPERTITAGQETEVRIKVREEEVSPKPRGRVLLSVFSPAGMKIGSLLKPTRESGEYLGSFPVEKIGTYKVKVETPAGSVEESIVIPGPLEGLDAAPDHEKLRKVSSASGGKLLFSRDGLLKEIGVYAEKGEKHFIEERRLPLWGSPYAFALILVLLVTEWYLRRRWGLI